MSMPQQHDGQRRPGTNTRAVNNSSVLAEFEFGGASSIRRDGRSTDHRVPSNLAQAGCPEHKGGVTFVPRSSDCLLGSPARKSCGDAHVTSSTSVVSPPRPTDNELAVPLQSIPEAKQVPERVLSPGLLTGLAHNKNVRVRHQQSPMANVSRGSSSRKMDIEPSAQQQARLGESSGHQTRPKNRSVASPSSPFDAASLDLFLESMASQYPVEKGGFDKPVNPYAQYFRTS